MENLNSCCFVARINEIKAITGADNIEQAVVGEWNCIIQKGQYAEGGLVVIATTDAVIPQDLSDAMNVTNYLRKGQRVRTVRLRRVYSECLIIPLKYASGAAKYANTKWDEGEDMMDVLKIYKYEPPVRQVQLAGGRKIKYKDNPNFPVYYKFPNLKNVPELFNEENLVQITRKIHGCNARYGVVKKKKFSLIDRFKKLFGNKWIDYEFVYGSHNVEKGSDSQGFYDTDVWKEVADKYQIKEKLWACVKKYKPSEIGNGIVVYGEIYGPGIQKNYDYGLKELNFAGFDIIWNGKYKNTAMAYYKITKNHTWTIPGINLPHVPILYEGPWSKEIQDQFTFNNFIEGTKVPHKGIVIKHVSGERNKIGKVINPDYLIYAEKHDIGDSH
jgi:RNA ligase (TIGR02306 family)